MLCNLVIAILNLQNTSGRLLLNTHEPMLSDNYQIILFKSPPNVSQKKNMSTAASRLRGAANTANEGVSVDGKWQRKGFTSLNGGVTAISIDSRKVLDIAILSKFPFLCLYLIMTLLLISDSYYQYKTCFNSLFASWNVKKCFHFVR